MYGGQRYRRLLAFLHEQEFIFTLQIDENRAIDGIDLRYRYAYETGTRDIPRRDMPCSLLEMMTALSLRCEEHIMDNPDIGNRTGKWFFDMIESMGLLEMDDRRFSYVDVQDAVDRCLRRDYAPDGKGGFFTIPGSKYDLRSVEIWYQAMWYFRGRT